MTAEHTAPDQGNGEWVHISLGERFKIRTSAADNGGTYVMLELIVDFQYGTRMHIHENEDEHFIVLAGTLARCRRRQDVQRSSWHGPDRRQGRASCLVQSVGYSPPNACHLFAWARRRIVQGSGVPTKR